MNLSSDQYMFGVIVAAHRGPLGSRDLEVTMKSFKKMNDQGKQDLFVKKLRELNSVLGEKISVMAKVNDAPLSAEEYLMPAQSSSFNTRVDFIQSSGSPRAMYLRAASVDTIGRIIGFAQMLT
jgi:hypothetical protein